MATVSQQLRTAREAKNLTIHQVAEITKVRTDHIRALEEGNYDAFSAPVYIKGFVRTYGNLLKLDTAALMRDLDSELSQSSKHREDPPLTKKEQGFVDFLMFFLSKVNWRFALPVLVLVALAVSASAAFRTWKEQKNQDPVAGLKPGVYKPVKGQGEELQVISLK